MLLHEERVDVDAADATLGYPLGQHYRGLASWLPDSAQGGEGLVRLDRFTIALAEALGCRSRPQFAPCDESVAWSWQPKPAGARAPA